MTTIGPGQRLAGAVAAQLARVRQRASGRTEGAGPGEPAARSAYTVSPAMAQRIAALAPNDPERPRKAVRIYLEAELAREFGAGLLNDPAFPDLLDAVQQRLDEDAPTANAVASLGRLLVAGKLKPP